MFIWLTTGKGRPDGNMILIYMIKNLKKKKKKTANLCIFCSFICIILYS